MDHHKNIEKKRGYEGKIFKMDTKWVKSFPKRSQTTLFVTIRRYSNLSYMHNEERKLMHITILLMAIARVYYVERGT